MLQYRASSEYECPTVIIPAVLKVENIWYGDDNPLIPLRDKWREKPTVTYFVEII